MQYNNYLVVSTLAFMMTTDMNFDYGVKDCKSDNYK